MTTKLQGTVAALTLAGAAFLIPNHANAALAYNDGDVLLAFRATGGTGAATDYLVNLGSASILIGSNTPITFSLGSIVTDLSNIYGATWFNRSDVLWSVSGVQKFGFTYPGGIAVATNTMFASRDEETLGTLGTASTTAWGSPSAFGAGSYALKVQSVGTKFSIGTNGAVVGTDQIESTNSSFALIQPISQTNSFRSFMDGGASNTAGGSYEYFNDLPGLEGDFTGGTANARLDMYQLTPGSGPAAFLGNFTINDGGTVTFTPDGVPEPSTVATFALGTALLGLARRRRSMSHMQKA